MVQFCLAYRGHIVKDMKTYKGRGFTLIELLVVISIIALLLSILIPALNKVKESARDVICRTNLKSMQLATILYTDAYEGKMPEYNYADGLWINKITVFMDDMDEARYCPRTKIHDNPVYSFGSARETYVWDWEGMEEPEQASYTINWWFYQDGSTDKNYYHNVSEAKNQYNVPVFADAIWVDAKPRHTDTIPADFDLDRGGNDNHMQRLVTNRHEDETNVGFLDGSQRAVELSGLWNLKWNKGFETIPEKFRLDGSPIYQN